MTDAEGVKQLGGNAPKGELSSEREPGSARCGFTQRLTNAGDLNRFDGGLTPYQGGFRPVREWRVCPQRLNQPISGVHLKRHMNPRSANRGAPVRRLPRFGRHAGGRYLLLFAPVFDDHPSRKSSLPVIT